MRKLIPVLLVVAVMLSGCTPLERSAYNTVVAAKAFLDSERKQHPDCATTPDTVVCKDLAQAVGAKDALIDAITVYCSGPDFNNGGACNPPAKGTPAATQAQAKLQNAISMYNSIAADLKTATGGK
jgi:uncharacterized protein YfaQ (DUF2300 family)